MSFFILTIVVYLMFGWGMEYNPCSRPWLAAPIITAFVVAAGILDAMTGLNTFCAKVLPGKRGDAIASKYMTQCTLLAVASGVAVMSIDTIGLGPACTISKLPLKCAWTTCVTEFFEDVAFVFIGGTLTHVTARFGSRMQHWVDGWGVEK